MKSKIPSEMFVSYLMELNKMVSPCEALNSKRIEEDAAFMLRAFEISRDVHIIPAQVEGEVVGFLIVFEGQQYQVDYDYLICSAYVLPAYRKNGLMTTLLSSFMEQHPGTYLLDVFAGNRAAERFWANRFQDADYQEAWKKECYQGLKKVKTIKYMPVSQ